ncbi:dTDP-4-dehydrorhamnose reductase [Sinorhizobium sp. A49]|uniref:dTDP-4-dehydrorhamnose reductase n=1 Tax=Sinorhizobium sp. A49 TaxID=1945861 RepID=UPI000984AF86|nr:dTDP-4-dehydrorhamnose reductase [Sinorhizobium sp. A49]OOG63077.1 dTDP-4-dehydrorhamnose reductase [Sinorhizobium sp. A49]
MRRILITGGTGQVGTELRNRPWPSDIELVAPTRQELDLSDCDAIEELITAGDFCAVINSGAYTAVDRAESDVATAWKVNALAPAVIAAATKRQGIPLIHVSTDYVFDGSKDGPYLEDDHVAPLGVYGGSKEAGEQAVRTGNPRHVILRTAWVFSAHGANFVKTMLRLGAERSEIRVVDDQRGSPTAASDIALALNHISLRLVEDREPHYGTYNFVNSGEATWYGLACELFAQREQAGYAVPILKPIGTSDYPTPARRPANSSLSTEKLLRDFGIEATTWQDALRRTLASMY